MSWTQKITAKRTDDASTARRSRIRKEVRDRIGEDPSERDVESIFRAMGDEGDPIEEVIRYLSNYKVQEVCDRVYHKHFSRRCDPEALDAYKNSFINDPSFTVSSLTKCLVESPEMEEKKAYALALENIFKTKKPVSEFSHLVKSQSCKGLRILYCGPFGKSGYCQAAKSYFYALFSCGADLSFRVVQHHRSNQKHDSRKDQVLIAHKDRPLQYDYVIIHTVPEPKIWVEIAAVERLKNPNVKLIGFTVWETDKVCPEWATVMTHMDMIVAPCEWNTQTFSKVVSPVPAVTVHNPIDDPSEDGAGPINPNFQLKEISSDDFVFYTINEWTNRKMISELIDTFIDTFEENDRVALYVKTSTVDYDTGIAYVNQRRALKVGAPKVILDCADLADEDIRAIHSRGQVYVSFCKSEGTGLGACEAAMFENPIMMTGYGGQMDYLKGAYYISSSEESPVMCHPLQNNAHRECRVRSGERSADTPCAFYPYYRTNQNWHTPSTDDAKRMFGMLKENYPLCRASAIFTKMYIQRNMNNYAVGARYAECLRSLPSRTRTEN